MVEPPRFLAATPGGEKIERLGESDGHSGVDELLRTARLRSSVWCRSELSVPWSFAVRARDAASFHLVLDGAGWLAVEGDGTQRLLATGDLVVLPHGDAHALRDDPSSPLVFLDDLLARSKPVDGRLVHGGGGARTEILCGGLVFEGAAATPLLASLPSVVHVRGADGRPPAALAPGSPIVIVVDDRRDLYPQILERAGLRLEQRLRRHVNRRTGRRAGEFFEDLLVARAG